MTPQPWLFVLLVVVGGHALAVGYAYLARDAAGRTESADCVASTDRTGRDDEVVCPECGAVNDPGYRYCGNCVAELPGRAGAGTRGVAPLGGRSL